MLSSSLYIFLLQADWLHRFESCHDYLVHLNAQELRHIVLGITLSQRSLKVCNVILRCMHQSKSVVQQKQYYAYPPHLDSY